MRGTRYTLVIAVALAGCSSLPVDTRARSGPTNQGSGHSPQSATSEGRLRPGRWSDTFSTSAGLRTTALRCVTDTELSQLAGNMPVGCTSANGFHRIGDGWVMDAECTAGRGLDHVRIAVDGDLHKHYVAEVTLSGPRVSALVRTYRIEATYKGACHGDE